MKKNIIWSVLGVCALGGCITRAPTTYELDRRAGFTPPGEPVLADDLAKMRTNSNIPRAPMIPVRIPPVIEKVWVADSTLADGAKMQGTWMFLEVEPGRWLDEVDPGAAPLVIPPALGTTKTPAASKK